MGPKKLRVSLQENSVRLQERCMQLIQNLHAACKLVYLRKISRVTYNHRIHKQICRLRVTKANLVLYLQEFCFIFE